jgi:hypothetical protein
MWTSDRNDEVVEYSKVSHDLNQVADKVVNKLTPGERAFLTNLKPYFEHYDWITNSAASELSGLAEGSVKRYFRGLTEKNVLEARGERKGRKYRLRSCR